MFSVRRLHHAPAEHRRLRIIPLAALLDSADESSSTYLAKVIVVLLGQPIESVVNHTFVAIEYEPTNAEITKMLTAIHGKETELVEFDDAQVNENCVSSHPLISLGAAVLRKSGMGWWDIPEAQRVEPIGWETEGVEAQLRNHIAA